MPAQPNFDDIGSDTLELLFDGLLKRLDTLNRTLSNIEECLRGIEQRMSYAKVLDSDD
jgi:hypothetical protein